MWHKHVIIVYDWKILIAPTYTHQVVYTYSVGLGFNFIDSVVIRIIIVR